MIRIVIFLSPRARSDLAVAVTAIHPSAISRFKGQLRCFATLSAHCTEHLSPGLTVTAVSGRAIALHHPGRAAQSAALGIIGIALLGEGPLLAYAEGEIGPAVRAVDGFVHKTHRMAFFLEIVG